MFTQSTPPQAERAPSQDHPTALSFTDPPEKARVRSNSSSRQSADKSDSCAALPDEGQIAAPELAPWVGLPPTERRAVMVGVVKFLQARHDELVDWLIREANCTRYKAELEWQCVHFAAADALSFDEAERILGAKDSGPVRVRRPDGLTSREAEVLDLLAAGNTNKDIAAELVLSVHTVQRHLQNAYRKVGVRNRAEAAAYIVRGHSIHTFNVTSRSR